MAGRLRRTLATVRMRTTIGAALVFAVALVAGGAVALTVLRHTLTDQVRSTAWSRADDLVIALESGLPSRDLGAVDDDEAFVQVIDSEGRVIAASRNLDGAAPVTDLQPDRSRRLDGTPFDDDPFLVVAVTADRPSGQELVLVGRTLETVEEAYDTALRILLIGGPLLVLLVAFLTWWVVGRALAPVDAMRRETDAVTATELHRRVTTPNTDDEIARLATTLNQMLERVETAQIRQRRFVSDASHELRSPIATIREHAEIALAHPRLTSTDELAAVVLDAGRRLAALVDDLLLLARTDELRGSHRVAVDLDDVVFEEVAHVRPHRDVDVDVRHVSAGRVIGDERQLRRVVANLVDNAGRHAMSRVALSLRTVDGSAVLEVEDDGPGIALEDRKRVFDRFVRLDDARTRADGGSGLGLAIVAAIVDAHGGTVRAHASPLGGARFEVRLPALDDHPALDEERSAFSVTQGPPADDHDVSPTEIYDEGSPSWRSASDPS